MNWAMMRAGLWMGWRSMKLGIQAFPDFRIVKIRLVQVGISVRVFFKGLAGVRR